MAWIVKSDIHNNYIPFTKHREQEEITSNITRRIEADWIRNNPDKPMWERIVRMGLNTGFPFPIPNEPFRLQLDVQPRKLPAVFTGSQTFILTKPILDAIESIEPNTHAYWPLDLSWKDGSKVEEERWYINVRQRLDTLLPEQSKDMWVTKPDDGRPGEYIFSMPPPDHKMSDEERRNNPPSLFASRERIQGHAIWNEYRTPGNTTMISDALFDLIYPNHSDGWDFAYYVREV